MTPESKSQMRSTDNGQQVKIKLYFQQRKHQTSELNSKVVEPQELPLQADEQGEEVEVEQSLLGLLRKCCKEPDKIHAGILQTVSKSSVQDTFFALLTRLVESELGRLSFKESVDFSAWLGNERFLSSLLWCLSLHEEESNSTIDNVTGFDKLLAIEQVIKHMPHRSESGINRLKILEERLLSYEVWTEEDIYRYIEAERSSVRSNLLLESPRKAVISMTSVQSSPYRVSKLEYFFRKYFRYAIQKIDLLCKGLGLTEAVQEGIWQGFLGMLERIEPDHRIMYRRQTSTILAALTYSVCRYNDIPITFKQIIGALGGTSDWYKSIWMGEGVLRTDLISFYNEVFLPTVQQLIHSLPLANEREDPVATVPGTPVTPRRRKNSVNLDGAAPFPSLHSPIMATSHLSKRVQLDMSPLKHSLTRNIPSTQTPIKYHLSPEENGKSVVSRRLNF